MDLGGWLENKAEGLVRGTVNRVVHGARREVEGEVRDAVRGRGGRHDDDDDHDRKPAKSGKPRWLDRDGDGKTELFGDDDDDKKQTKDTKGKSSGKPRFLDRDGDGKTEIFGEDNKGLHNAKEKVEEGVEKVKEKGKGLIGRIKGAFKGDDHDHDDDKHHGKDDKKEAAHGKSGKPRFLDRDGDGKTEIFGEDNKGLQKVGEKIKGAADKVKSAVTGHDDDDKKPSRGQSGRHGHDPRDRNGDGEVSFGEKARAVMSGLVERGAHMVEGAAHGVVNHSVAAARQQAQGHGQGNHR